MKHSSSRDLYAYWDTQRAKRAAPERSDIDPAAIRHALGDIFILAADFVDDQRFRLAGTRICALFGRELKGESFAAVWSKDTRNQLRGMVADVIGENTGLVAGIRGHNGDGGTVDLELLLLPLAHRGHARVRAIGVLAATDMPYWVGEKPLKELAHGTVRHIGAELEQAPVRAFTLTSSGGELRRGFMVYQGGLMQPPNEKAG